MDRLITVFGATGAQGGGLARALLADPARRFAVRAVTRKPEAEAARALVRAGAQVVQADLDDAASVRRALDGAYGAFCVTNYWEHFSPAREQAQAAAMAAAAEEARVQHVIWSTLEDTRRLVPPGTRMPVLQGRYNVPHFDGKGEADRLFTERGLPVTLLLTSGYFENLIFFGMGPQRRADGALVIALPTGTAAVPWIAAEDIGRCAFGVLARGPETAGMTIGVAGEHLTGAELAAQLSSALGVPIAFDALSPEAYRAQGFAGADDLGNMFQFKRDFETVYRAARSVAGARELNPALQDFAQWLARQARRIPVPPRAAAA